MSNNFFNCVLGKPSPPKVNILIEFNTFLFGSGLKFNEKIQKSEIITVTLQEEQL